MNIDELVKTVEKLQNQLNDAKKIVQDIYKAYTREYERNEELEYEIERQKKEIQRIYEDRDENYRHIEYSSQI